MNPNKDSLQKEKEIVQLNLTREEARHILHALVRTSARNQYGDLKGILDTVDKVETELSNKIYKWQKVTIKEKESFQ